MDDEKTEAMKELIRSLKNIEGTEPDNLSDPELSVFRFIQSQAARLLGEIHYLNKLLLKENFKGIMKVYDLHTELNSNLKRLIQEESK